MAKLVPEKHPALHTIAEEVPREMIGSAELKKLIKDMKTALRSYESEGFVGVAIAAPQIGVSLRVFLVHDTSEDKDRDIALPDLVAINPVILKSSKKKRSSGEGCLSVVDKYGTVTRAERVTLRALDENGKEYERGASGLLAQIFQHEVDHLDGILFVDRASKVIDKSELDLKKSDKEQDI